MAREEVLEPVSRSKGTPCYRGAKVSLKTQRVSLGSQPDDNTKVCSPVHGHTHRLGFAFPKPGLVRLWNRDALRHGRSHRHDPGSTRCRDFELVSGSTPVTVDWIVMTQSQHQMTGNMRHTKSSPPRSQG